jgi:hypothetical protein
MSQEYDPKPQVDFFNSILRNIIEPSPTSTSLHTLKIHLNTLNLGLIYDPSDTLPEQVVIIQNIKKDPATLIRRTVCITHTAGRFNKVTYETTNKLEEEMRVQKEILQKRKNPPSITKEELSTPSADIQTLKDFAEEAQKRKEEKKERKQIEETPSPQDINALISGLSLLTSPVNIIQAENILAQVFGRQSE